MDDLPLNLNVLKPSFAESHSHSAFSFQATAIPDMEDIYMTDIVDDVNEMDKDVDIAIEDKHIDGVLRFFLFCFVYLCLFIIFRSESWRCHFDSLLFDSYRCHTIDS